jgi:hypothetical protein
MRSAVFVGGELDGARLAIEGESFPAIVQREFVRLGGTPQW